MKVEELMVSKVASCRADAPLDQVARKMWDGDCGAVVLTDPQGVAIGMITDRDICMAGLTQGVPLSAIPAHTAGSRRLAFLKRTDNVTVAEGMMAHHRVRRLPVLDEAGHPVGILSITDLIRNAHLRLQPVRALAAERILQTLMGITAESPMSVAAE